MITIETSAQSPTTIRENIRWLRTQTEYIRAQRGYVREVNKSSPEDWESMKNGINELQSFARAGGIMKLLEGPFQRVVEIIQGDLGETLVPIVNALTSLAGNIENLVPLIAILADGLKLIYRLVTGQLFG